MYARSFVPDDTVISFEVEAVPKHHLRLDSRRELVGKTLMLAVPEEVSRPG